MVTEAREFRPDGTPPVFPGLQDGSVSTWQIAADGSLTPINLDVASGENNTGRTACWLDFSDDNTFFVSNAIEAGLASFSFDNGEIVLLNQTAAQGTGATGNTTDPASAFATTEGWIDLWISDDGRYLYQAYGLTGTIGVYEIDGAELTLVQEFTGGLPSNNIQGIVSVGSRDGTTSTTDQVEDLDALMVQVYPNPSTGNQVNIDFELEQASEYSISIIDINGAIISQDQSSRGIGQVGLNTVNINNLALPSGIYLVRVDLEIGSFSKKFIVQK